MNQDTPTVTRPGQASKFPIDSGLTSFQQSGKGGSKSREREQVAQALVGLKVEADELKKDRAATMSNSCSDDDGSFDEDMDPAIASVWKDVEPLWVDDGGKVVAIQYSAEHKKATAYFKSHSIEGREK
eukprot:gene21428-28393_t